ncbi:MAG TPA: HEPN domain-containing protein [Nitrospiraceae bacterium]|nr:HEPN domain-containing protein [Nitrospiraceae bacterium]
MTNESLARSYLRKANDRLKVLDLLIKEGGYSDVVREVQELVELALKGMLRAIGIEPPKLHDVGGMLVQHRDRFEPDVQAVLGILAEISKELRKDREFAFYGDVDFIPTEEYSVEEGKKAREGATRVLEAARLVIES